jgi:hypothetical protein
MLETQQTFTTPIIGDDIRVPVFVRGMERPETVELSLRFDRDLAYHGTFSLRGTPLDISGSTTANSSRIRIPASELKPNEISAYADFSVYVDTVMVSRIDIDSLAVVSAQAPCQYITDTRTYALISGPSDCGSVTISNYLRYGRMPMFEIYPNPASGSFTIVSSEALGMARVEIADKIGIVHRSEQVLLGERGSSVKFDAGGLASGLYFVRIIAGPFNTALPVVIEK